MTHCTIHGGQARKTDGAVYAAGWTISGVAVLGAIIAVWILGI
jgi:hypothetical protein